MKNIKYQLILLFINSSFLFAQNQIMNKVITYDGLISEYPIKTSLSFKKDYIYGEYIYKKYPDRNPISLSSIQNKNNLIIEETIYDTQKKKDIVTAFFTLNIFNNYKQLNGKWTNVSNKKIFDFTLNAIEQNADNNYYYNVKLTPSTDKKINEFYKVFNQIEIFDHNKKFIQTIDFPNSFSFNNSGIEIRLEDYNFDGYLDIIITHFAPFVAKNDHAEYYLIYNPSSKKFKYEEKYNTELAYIIKANHLKQTLETYTADGNGNESNTSYIVKNNNFYKINYWKITEEGSSLEIKYKVINGKSVEINRKVSKK